MGVCVQRVQQLVVKCEKCAVLGVCLCLVLNQER